MGEYVWTAYCIGGKLPKAKIEEFEELLGDFSEADFDVDFHNWNNSNSLGLQGMLNYGNHDELDEFLRNNNLSFCANWAAASGCFDSGLRYWKPGMDEVKEVSANDDGEPTVSLGDLQRGLASGKTLEAMIAEMLPQSSEAVPVFELITD